MIIIEQKVYSKYSRSQNFFNWINFYIWGSIFEKALPSDLIKVNVELLDHEFFVFSLGFKNNEIDDLYPNHYVSLSKFDLQNRPLVSILSPLWIHTIAGNSFYHQNFFIENPGTDGKIIPFYTDFFFNHSYFNDQDILSAFLYQLIASEVQMESLRMDDIHYALREALEFYIDNYDTIQRDITTRIEYLEKIGFDLNGFMIFQACDIPLSLHRKNGTHSHLVFDNLSSYCHHINYKLQKNIKLLNELLLANLSDQYLAELISHLKSKLSNFKKFKKDEDTKNIISNLRKDYTIDTINSYAGYFSFKPHTKRFTKQVVKSSTGSTLSDRLFKCSKYFQVKVGHLRPIPDKNCLDLRNSTYDNTCFIMESLFAPVYNMLLKKSRSPLIRFCKDDQEPTDYNCIFMASEYLSDFITLSEIKKQNNPQSIEKMSDVLISCLYLGEHDYHANNLGVLKSNEPDQPLIAAKVDHGWTFTEWFDDVESMIYNFFHGLSHYHYTSLFSLEVKQLIDSIDKILTCSHEEIMEVIDRRIYLLKNKLNYDPSGLKFPVFINNYFHNRYGMKEFQYGSFDVLRQMIDHQLQKHREHLIQMQSYLKIFHAIENCPVDYYKSGWINEICLVKERINEANHLGMVAKLRAKNSTSLMQPIIWAHIKEKKIDGLPALVFALKNNMLIMGSCPFLYIQRLFPTKKKLRNYFVKSLGICDLDNVIVNRLLEIAFKNKWFFTIEQNILYEESWFNLLTSLQTDSILDKINSGYLGMTASNPSSDLAAQCLDIMKNHFNQLSSIYIQYHNYVLKRLEFNPRAVRLTELLLWLHESDHYAQYLELSEMETNQWKKFEIILDSTKVIKLKNFIRHIPPELKKEFMNTVVSDLERAERSERRSQKRKAICS